MAVYHIRHRSGARAVVIAIGFQAACDGRGWDIWETSLEGKQNIEHYILESEPINV